MKMKDKYGNNLFIGDVVAAEGDMWTVTTCQDIYGDVTIQGKDTCHILKRHPSSLTITEN